MARTPREPLSLSPGDDVRPVVPATGLIGREGFEYVASPKLIAAINAAIVLERPLLLTGEPGCGKTDFAWAVANAVNATRSERSRFPDDSKDRLLQSHVRSDSRARDLLYHYDSLHRFGDAHHADTKLRQRSIAARHYVTLLPLGEALTAPERQVVLIDEIDKAPRDLPNDLLRELDAGEFEIRELREIPDDTSPPVLTRWQTPLQRTMGRPKVAKAPIVIITSNVERQLPDPFLRRCVFFHIEFPDDEALERLLAARIEGVPYVSSAVKLFLTLRRVPRLTKKPATSELIDWTETLGSLYERGAVERRLSELVAEVSEDNKRGLSLPKDRWRELPAMHCLLKLREDLDTVGC